MERDYEFTIGSRVRMRDAEDGTLVYGTVTDKTRDTVFIKWDDLREPCEHDKTEFHLIKVIIK